jgi:hypothetical protein
MLTHRIKLLFLVVLFLLRVFGPARRVFRFGGS